MPRPELNPLTNPVLGRNLGRWAQVYFTSPPEKREEAVSELLQELENDPNPSPLPARSPSSPHSATSLPPAPVISALRQARDSVQVAMVQPELRCPTCSRANTEDNRFCGYCGNSLEEGAGAPVEVEQQRSETPIVEPDKNLQWLRDKELASLQVSSSRSFGWIKYAVLTVAVLLAGLLYLNYRSQISSNVGSAPQVPAERNPEAAPRDLPAADRNAKKTIVNAANVKKEKAARYEIPARSASAVSSAPAEASSDASGSADFQLAQRYLAGSSRNTPEAAKFLWRAVGKHNTEAAVTLSSLYARGDGVPKSCDQARILLIAAAKRGSSVAAQQLRQFDSGTCR